MPYATQQDAVDLYGEQYVLTSVDRNSDGQPDATALSDALAQASSLIDSYLSTRYTVPLATVPDLVVKYCIDIALYQCSPDLTRTDEKRQRYEDALAWLKEVSKGIANLGEAVADAGADDGEVAYVTQTRLFNRTKMRGL